MRNPLLGVGLIRCLWLLIVAFALTATSAVQIAAQERDRNFRQIKSLSAVVTAANRLAQKHGPQHVLVAFDVDNTLLTATHDFGSEAWWEWQLELHRSPSPSGQRVGHDLDALIKVQTLAYAVGDMTVTEPNLVRRIHDLTEHGHPVIAITARNPLNHDATIRELDETGISFSTAPDCGPPLCQRRGQILSGDIANAAKALEKNIFKIDPSILKNEFRSIGYGDGIMMTAGQNKGLMLQLLLASSVVDVRAIVFVDDSRENIEDVEKAFDADTETELITYLYTRLDDSDRAFKESTVRKRNATETWSQLRDVLCERFRRFCGI